MTGLIQDFKDFEISHVKALLMRFWLEYRQVVRVQIVRDLLDRLIYLFAFGFGMGAVVKTMDGMPYLTFLVPGIAASTGVFVMTIAMTYGVYERMTGTKLWSAWLATPLRLPEILVAELLYACLRSVPSILILFAIALMMGALPSVWGAVASLPIILLANLVFGAVALCFTTHIHRSMHFAYVNTLWTTPMFLCSGVFYDVNQVPGPLQVLANILPLKHVLSSIRPLMTGQEINWVTLVTDISVLLALAVGAFSYALWRFKNRMIA